MTGMSSPSRGPAVTGPTHAATTGPRSAARTRSPQPCASAARRKLAAAGALVNATASVPRVATLSTSRRSGAGSSGGTQRYTGTSMTSAPAIRSVCTRSGSGSPCSCTAIRAPSRSWLSIRCSSTSLEDSDSGDHASRSSQARIAPRAFGPRASTVAEEMASVSFSTSPHVSAASTQPRKPMPVVATTKSSGAARQRSVASRSSLSSASGTMRIAGA
jgi:hypothetical protein